MNSNRKKIDQIDEKIMELLEERFALVGAIGIEKQLRNLPIYNQQREEEILKKADLFFHNHEIKQIYQTIFQASKNSQQVEYGLVGKSLAYSLSPFIYKELGLTNYGVAEVDDFTLFANSTKWNGFNVTNPYKRMAYEWCENKSEEARQTGVVNCIIDKTGYNFDFLAIQAILKRKWDTRKWKTIIIGHGATAASVAAAIAGEVIYLVRQKKNENEYLLQEYDRFSDADCIINATPYGTYPLLEKEPLFPLTAFSKLKLVWDVVYNPLYSPLVRETLKRNVSVMNGLPLLIQQAIYSYQSYTNKKISNHLEKIKQITNKLMNIVLIGLSFSGKSTLAKQLSLHFQKKLVDFDDILANQKKDLKSVLQQGSIASFRQMELELAKQYGSQFSQVIAPGGGIVLSEEAMFHLKNNAIIIFLDVPLGTLLNRMDDTRPLIKNKTDLEQMASQRKPLYLKYQDLTFTGQEDEKEMVNKIEAYMDNQWA